jgi:hypothetical protein
MKEIFFRFLIGGFAVSAFATLGDVFKPKSFAGLFGAAPSVAIATLALAVTTNGAAYAAAEGTSMAAGAFAFLIYACLVASITRRFRFSVLAVAVLLLPIWFMSALGSWVVWLKAARRL